MSHGALGVAWSLEAQSRTQGGLAEGSCLGPENKMRMSEAVQGLKTVSLTLLSSP